MNFFKRQLPVIVAFVAGLVFWLQFYVPSHLSQNMLETFSSSWAIIMAAAAFVLGVLSSVHHHWGKIALRREGWGYSAVALTVFGSMLLAGWLPVSPVNWSEIYSLVLLAIGLLLGLGWLLKRQQRPAKDQHALGAASLLVGGLGLIGVLLIQPLATGTLLFMQVRPAAFTAQTIEPDSFFSWFFDYCFVPLDATMFSLLAFYIASAAFRAFRARSFEATALLIAGCIVMIGRVPLGEQLGIHSGNFHLNVADVAGWILNNPNNAAQRGILLGVILSQVAISLRILFGIERTYMGGGD
jgi:hypothetical protein